MLHPNTEVRRIDSEIGFGVFASGFIPKGTVTWGRDELEIAVTPDPLVVGRGLRRCARGVQTGRDDGGRYEAMRRQGDNQASGSNRRAPYHRRRAAPGKGAQNVGHAP